MMGVAVGEALAPAEWPGTAEADEPAEADATAVDVAVGVAVVSGVALSVGSGVGVSVGVAPTPKMNWPPASRWKWTDCRFLREVCALDRIWWGSVSDADVQPATSATTARTPAAVVASDFRRDTWILHTSCRLMTLASQGRRRRAMPHMTAVRSVAGAGPTRPERPANAPNRRPRAFARGLRDRPSLGRESFSPPGSRCRAAP